LVIFIGNKMLEETTTPEPQISQVEDTPVNNLEASEYSLLLYGWGSKSRPIVDQMEKILLEQKFKVGGVSYDSSDLTNNQIRYFHKKDQEMATEIRNILQEILIEKGLNSKVEIVPLYNVPSPKKQIEIYIY